MLDVLLTFWIYNTWGLQGIVILTIVVITFRLIVAAIVEKTK